MNDEGEGPLMTLGTCCVCGRIDPSVRNVLMLDRRSPEPGNGCWGCLECGLEMEGAVAVACDECMKTLDGPPKYVCLGVPSENRRILYEQLSPEPFRHNEEKHIELDELERSYAQDRKSNHQGNGHPRKRAGHRRRNSL